MTESAVLYRLAAQLDEQAAALRSRARRLGSATEQVRWHSSAATLFRARAAGSAAAMFRAADGVERAADALRGHARTVAHLEQVLAAAERVANKVGHAAGTIANCVGELI